MHRENSQTQFASFTEQIRVLRELYDEAVQGALPILERMRSLEELGSLELVRRQRSDLQLREDLRGADDVFRGCLRSFAVSLGAHVLAVVVSHHPTLYLSRVRLGFAEGTTRERQDELLNLVGRIALNLAVDVLLFGDDPTA